MLVEVFHQLDCDGREASDPVRDAGILSALMAAVTRTSTPPEQRNSLTKQEDEADDADIFVVKINLEVGT